jgi:hypothetical protein
MSHEQKPEAQREELKVWDLRETAADRAIKRKVKALARFLRRGEEKARQIRAECEQLASYQEAERMFDADLEDPPTVGFNLSGSLDGAIEDLGARAGLLEHAAAETVEDLLRRRGSAGLERFRR